MTAFKILAITLASMSILGCASTYTQKDVSKVASKLLSDKSVAIAVPVDGQYGPTVYSGSGHMTATAVRAAFARHSNSVTIVANCKDLNCLMTDRKQISDYYVVPEILHWEDRATEWSGIPDKIEIKINVFDGLTGNNIASSIISGKSKWVTLGGDKPQDLLPEPLNAYVETLY
jgi:hypothetical protein